MSLETIQKSSGWQVGGIDAYSFETVRRPTPIDNGIVSDFGYDGQRSNGYQAAEYESAVEQRKQERKRAISGKRRAKIYNVESEYVLRADIIARDNSTCHICGQRCEPDDIHLDHVVPLSRGGSHTADNIRVAHVRCNLSKGVKLLTEL